MNAVHLGGEVTYDERKDSLRAQTLGRPRSQACRSWTLLAGFDLVRAAGGSGETMKVGPAGGGS